MSLFRRERRTIQVDDDPRDAIGRELKAAIERAEAQAHRPRAWAGRPRRQVLVIAMGTGLALLGAGGATAVIQGTTGIPAVDELLDVRHARRGNEQVTAAGQGRATLYPHSQRPAADIRPAGRQNSPPVAVPSSTGRKTQYAAYLSRDDQVCVSYASSINAGHNQAFPTDIFGCQPLRDVSKVLSENKVGFLFFSPVLLTGYASPDAVAVRVLGPHGPLSTRLSPPWTPEAEQAPAMRLFVAFIPTYLDRLGPRHHRVSNFDPRRYRARALLEDGDRVTVGTFPQHR